MPRNNTFDSCSKALCGMPQGAFESYALELPGERMGKAFIALGFGGI